MSGCDARRGFLPVAPDHANGVGRDVLRYAE